MANVEAKVIVAILLFAVFSVTFTFMGALFLLKPSTYRRYRRFVMGGRQIPWAPETESRIEEERRIVVAGLLAFGLFLCWFTVRMVWTVLTGGEVIVRW